MKLQQMVKMTSLDLEKYVYGERYTLFPELFLCCEIIHINWQLLRTMLVTDLGSKTVFECYFLQLYHIHLLDFHFFVFPEKYIR